MAVHVDEVHAEVIPSAPAAPAAAPAGGHDQLGAAQERWLEARGLAESLARRVAAVGFDD